jgi:trehalose synthase
MSLDLACHVDLSDPHGNTWEYLAGFIRKYDAVILSCKAYKQKLRVPQLVFMPAIDPFNVKNRQLTDEEMDERLPDIIFHSICRW